MLRVGFIGTGTIAAAMVQGIRASTLRSWPIILSPRNAQVAGDLAKTFPDVTVATCNQGVVDGSDLVILAIRPQVAEEVVSSLVLRPEQKVISLIAGLDHRQIAEWTGAGSVCRAIPLPFIAARRDATPVYPPDPDAVSFFGAIGQVLPVSNLRDFNTFAALSALMSSFFGIAEIASDWAAEQGMHSDQAKRYIGQLFGNLGDTLRNDPLAVEELRTGHSTRGGLNEQLFADFRANGGGAVLASGLDAVLRRVSAVAQ